jgi:hypothetical protein
MTFPVSTAGLAGDVLPSLPKPILPRTQVAFSFIDGAFPSPTLSLNFTAIRKEASLALDFSGAGAAPVDTSPSLLLDFISRSYRAGPAGDRRPVIGGSYGARSRGALVGLYAVGAIPSFGRFTQGAYTARYVVEVSFDFIAAMLPNRRPAGFPLRTSMVMDFVSQFYIADGPLGTATGMPLNDEAPYRMITAAPGTDSDPRIGGFILDFTEL